MLIDAWIYALPAEWDALNYDYPVEAESPPPDPLSNMARYVYDNAVTGWWKDYGAYSVYNVLGSRKEIDEILANLTDVHATYGWLQENGADNWDYPTIQADILAVMKDHVIYNASGTIESQMPASYENPNWGHVFFGQKERIFAGAFTDGFSEGFR